MPGWRTTVKRDAARLADRAARVIPPGRRGSALSLRHAENRPRPALLLPHGPEERLRRQVIRAFEGSTPSPSSRIAVRLAFQRRWMRLPSETRDLLHAKYILGLTAKEIATGRGRGESESSIENKLATARRKAQEVFEDRGEQ